MRPIPPPGAGLGQHNDEINGGRLGMSAEEIDRRQDGQSLCQVPTHSMTLPPPGMTALTLYVPPPLIPA